MRFHHSTRRGRNRLANHHPSAYHHYQQALAAAGGGARLPLTGAGSAAGRWAQLAYCRETNIHFNRRVPIWPPEVAPLDTDESRQIEREQECDYQDLELRNELSSMSLGERRRTSRKSSATRDQQPRQDQPKQDHNQEADDFIQRQTNGRLNMGLVREKLVAQVDKHPFWSNRAAKRMQLTGVELRRVLIYELTSFCERRELEWKYEPYRGGLVHATPFKRLPLPAASSIAAPGEPTSTEPKLSYASLGLEASRSKRARPAGDGCASSGDATSSSGFAASPLHTAGSGPVPATDEQHREANEDAYLAYLTSSRTGADHRSLVPIRRANSASATPAPTLDSGAGSATATVSGAKPTSHSNSPTTIASLNSVSLAGSRFEPASAIERRLAEPEPSAVWSIDIPPQVRPAPFKGHVHCAELPDSSFVKRCHGCQGRGRLKCNSCYGVGYEVCVSCSGKGTMRFLSASSSGGSSGCSRSRRSPIDDDNDDSAAAAAAPFASSTSTAGATSSNSSAKSAGRREEPGGISGGSTLTPSAWVSESCHYCHGDGQKRCWVCAGKSYNHCFACNGSGQLRCYLSVNVTWLNHRDESIINNADNIIPKERLRLSSGLVLVEQSAERLAALQRLQLVHYLAAASNSAPSATDPRHAHAPLPATPGGQRRPEVGGATPSSGDCEDARQLECVSRRLLERQRNAYRQERLLSQRHRVTQIECHIVSYEWKQRRGHFVIYGNERKVYIAKYPFKSLCNIT